MAFRVLYGLSFSQAASREELRRAFLQSPDNAADRDENGPPEGDRLTGPEGFAWELVVGIWTHSAALDELISRFSHNWRVDRLGRIERTLLRLALFEMLYRVDIPPKVAINEALELARQFGGHNASSFINGILDAAAKALENREIFHQLEASQ